MFENWLPPINDAPTAARTVISHLAVSHIVAEAAFASAARPGTSSGNSVKHPYQYKYNNSRGADDRTLTNRLSNEYKYWIQEKTEIDALVTQVLTFAIFQNLSVRFRVSLKRMLYYGARAATGIFLFAWAANPKKEQVSEKTSPVEVDVTLLGPGIIQPASVPAFEVLGHVRPFVTGKADVLEQSASTPTADCRCGNPDDLIRSIQLRSTTKILETLFLIGSADKFELHARLRSHYGSNGELARARAQWVRDRLLSSNVLPSNRVIVILTVGAGIHGLNLASVATAADRSVTVLGIWGACGGGLEQAEK